MKGLFSFFKHQLAVSAPPLLPEEDILPIPGNVMPCVFSHQGAIVYAMCLVEERKETSLLLHVQREMGMTPLVGLRVGAAGQLEMDDQLISMRVVRVSLPWITVAVFPGQRRPVQRQSLRVPATFTVRFRSLQSPALLQAGTGINISTGGFCFAFTGAEPPALGTLYESELTIHITRTQEVRLRMEVEVRWISQAPTETTVGVRVTDPACSKDLTSAVSQLQHLMSRQPEDYLTVENKRLHLH